ncbi:hypothetical protein TVAG_345520 [Trichomonas vaginalis G3]|uniref:Uncharacterized protein n=1 Tax=Trichomonas vaginalis (strain ATCC PRA-98 / G3) TaxID=412133 RepID=A2FVR4_TRIV3|nr:protein ubiquitination [Trichomonas vaginalis G3]EAX90992.1 hypothetical protein TVAG_345520 [Trichomonas vaginalis G3]KAI5510655.1 protein ubiquitination [Trichomonas vaginalis G3]|eukprot:XP_001303922.1 hypothetical protein [Trichomonas vaginalis G3]
MHHHQDDHCSLVKSKLFLLEDITFNLNISGQRSGYIELIIDDSDIIETHERFDFRNNGIITQTLSTNMKAIFSKYSIDLSDIDSEKMQQLIENERGQHKIKIYLIDEDGIKSNEYEFNFTLLCSFKPRIYEFYRRSSPWNLGSSAEFLLNFDIKYIAGPISIYTSWDESPKRFNIKANSRGMYFYIEAPDIPGEHILTVFLMDENGVKSDSRTDIEQFNDDPRVYDTAPSIDIADSPDFVIECNVTGLDPGKEYYIGLKPNNKTGEVQYFTANSKSEFVIASINAHCDSDNQKYEVYIGEKDGTAYDHITKEVHVAKSYKLFNPQIFEMKTEFMKGEVYYIPYITGIWCSFKCYFNDTILGIGNFDFYYSSKPDYYIARLDIPYTYAGPYRVSMVFEYRDALNTPFDRAYIFFVRPKISPFEKFKN